MPVESNSEVLQFVFSEYYAILTFTRFQQGLLSSTSFMASVHLRLDHLCKLPGQQCVQMQAVCFTPHCAPHGFDKGEKGLLLCVTSFARSSLP
jgi:hypothetical protein